MNPLENIPFYDEDLSLVEEEVPQPQPQPHPQLPNVVNINIVSSTRATPSQAFIRHSNQGRVGHRVATSYLTKLEFNLTSHKPKDGTEAL